MSNLKSHFSTWPQNKCYPEREYQFIIFKSSQIINTEAQNEIFDASYVHKIVTFSQHIIYTIGILGTGYKFYEGQWIIVSMRLEVICI